MTTTDYKAVIQDLHEKRARIDQAIAAIAAIVGEKPKEAEEAKPGRKHGRKPGSKAPKPASAEELDRGELCKHCSEIKKRLGTCQSCNSKVCRRCLHDGDCPDCRKAV